MKFNDLIFVVFSFKGCRRTRGRIVKTRLLYSNGCFSKRFQQDASFIARRTDPRYQFVGRSYVLNNRVSSLSRHLEGDLATFISLILLP